MLQAVQAVLAALLVVAAEEHDRAIRPDEEGELAEASPGLAEGSRWARLKAPRRRRSWH